MQNLGVVPLVERLMQSHNKDVSRAAEQAVLTLMDGTYKLKVWKF